MTTERLSSLEDIQEIFREDLRFNCEQLFFVMMRESGIDTTQDIVRQFVIELAKMATDDLCEELDMFNAEVVASTDEQMRAFAEYGGFDWESFKAAVDNRPPFVV